MPKINKYQIINFKYGTSGNRLLSDKIITLNGDHLQMEATNSVGKSMSIQTLIQAICPLADVNKKFIDIYNSKEPIYTTIEWILDDEKTKLITGIGFEKRSVINLEEGVKDKKSNLYKFFTYTIELCDRIQGIEDIEFYIQNNSVNTLKSLNAVNEYIKKIKTNYPDKVCIFGQNSQAQQKYREKLLEYGIFQSEWKDILIKLNSGEAVLSSFFEEYNTTEKFMKNKILPLIDSNLNKNSSKVSPIMQLREQVAKFIEQCIKNEADISSYNDFETLLNFTVDLREKLKHISNIDNEINEIINELSQIYYYTLNENLKVKTDIKNLKDDITNLNSEVVNVNYEEASYDLFKTNENIKEMENTLSNMNEKILSLETKIKEKNNMISILKYQDLNTQLNKENEDISKKEACKENLTLKSKELTEKLNTIGYSIKVLAMKNDENILIKINDAKNEISKIKDVINQLDLTKNNKINESKNKEIEITKLELKINNYNNDLNNFSNKFNTINSFKEVDLLEEKIDYNSYVNLLKNNLNEDNSFKKSLENKSIDIEKKINELANNKYILKNSLNEAQSKIKEIDEQITEITNFEVHLDEIVQTYDLEADILYNVDNINKSFLSLISKINNDKNSLLKEKIKQEDELNRFKNLSNLYIDEELMSLLYKNCIDVMFGFNYLIEMDTSLENKTNMINQYPLLPYSLLVSKKDFDRLKKIEIDYRTKFSTPIIIKEELDNLTIKRDNSIVSVNNLGLLMSFDLNLLDEEMRNENIKKIEIRISKIEDKSKLLDEQLIDLRKIIFNAENIQYSKSKKSELINELNRLHENFDSYNSQIKSIEKQFIELSEERKSVVDDIKSYDHKISNLKLELEGAINLKKMYNTVKDFEASNISLKKDLLKINQYICNLSENINSEHLKLNEKNLILNNLDIDRKNNSNIMNTYSLYDNSDIIEGTIDELISKFEVLKNNNVISNIDDLNYDISNALARKLKIEKEMNEIKEELKFEDILERVILDDISKIKKEIESLMILKKNLNSKKKLETKNLNREEGISENKLNNIEKKYKKAPIQIEDIDNYNFKDRLNNLFNEIKTVNQKIEDLTSKGKDFERLMNDLNKYKNNKMVVMEFDINEIVNKSQLLIKKLNENETNKLKLLKECAIIRKDIEKFNLSKNDKYRLIADGLNLDDITINGQLETANKIELYITNNIDKVKNAKEHAEAEKAILNKQIKNYLTDCIDELKVLNKLGKVKGEVLFNINIPDLDKINFLIIDDILNEIIESKDINMVNTTINSFYLLNRLINISNLKIKVVQYELNNKKSTVNWDKVIQSTSGGQRFCISFIILTILMEYKRYNSKELTHKSNGKVLIMDNPFGETSEIEFLTLVFKLADRFKVQIISYTHVTNASIRLQFNRIYRMTVERTTTDKELVVIEEEKNEIINEVVNTNNYIIGENSVNYNMFSLID